ncbi:MAG: Abi-alpha family protein [Solirubrobacteraceae bacterium]
MSSRDLFDDLPSLARLALGAYWRTAEFALRSSLELTRGALHSLGVDVPQPRPPAPAPAPDRPAAGPDPGAPAPAPAPAPSAQRVSLRERGEELLRRSADVHEDEEGHPAYERILGEILPDEARVLRLLYAAGAQPAVDVRAGALPLNSATELIAPGLTMIGAEAGCRRPERVPAYLNNLYRLGLVWFSREAVPEQGRYQVLEAQPDVVEALRSKGRARTVRRSIALTPFGTDFCERVLPPTTGEFSALRRG